MMGHPDMVKEVKKEDLAPLIPPERLEQLQSKYVQSVQVNWSGQQVNTPSVVSLLANNTNSVP